MPSSTPPSRRLLILGGTQEARECAARLNMQATWDVTLSLAGRTLHPRPQPVPTRTGGFGGWTGLRAYLEQYTFDALLIATHPFAAQIATHGVLAAKALGLPVVRLLRPAWRPEEGMTWHAYHTLEEAIDALGPPPRRVFMPVGRQAAPLLERAPHHHYLLRSVDPVAARPQVPHFDNVLHRGARSIEEEQQWMEQHAIDAMICKNSGGDAMSAKLVAAHLLSIDVFMVERPCVNAPVDTVDSVATAIALLERMTQRV